MFRTLDDLKGKSLFLKFSPSKSSKQARTRIRRRMKRRRPSHILAVKRGN